MIEIRLAENSDASELYRLNTLFNGDEDGIGSIDAIAESIRSNKQEIVCIAADGDRLVGFCCAQILLSMCYSYKYSEITELYVMDDYRGQGIGKRLVMFTEKELANRGIKHIHILTGNDNEVAQTLYRSCGYNNTTEILLDKSIE